MSFDAASLVIAVAAALGVLGVAVWLWRNGFGNSEELVQPDPETYDALVEVEYNHLKLEAQRYANIINMSYNPVWQRDENLNIIYCNLAFTEVAEQSIEDIEDIASLELFPGHRDLSKKAWDTGQEQMVDRHIVVGGNRRLFRLREIPLKSDGVITGYAVDITDQENAQEEVRRHISAQQDFLESSTSAMAIFSQDMRLQFYNFAFVSLWKLDDSWLDSKPTYGEILEMLREKRKLPEHANFPAFKAQHLKLFTDLIETHEDIFYLPDGKILRVVVIPHALGGLMVAYEDVTDRLALERSYNTLIAVQRETLDNLHESVVVFGEDGRLRLSNPTYATIWQLEEKYLHTEPHVREVLDLCKGLYNAAEWEEYKETFITNLQKRNLQLGRLERSDGSVLDWRMVPLPDGGTLVTYTDVTDTMVVERSLREKYEALQEADRLKSEFLANVSYELRSPLTSISGFSDILRNEYFGELTDKQREYVEGIHQSSQQLGGLINNILDLASIEAGYMQLDLSEFDLYDMLDAVLLLLKERMKILDLKICKQCEPDIGSMVADETRIKQVLFNLMSNAAKYSRSGGIIEVGIEAEGSDHIRLWVRDHGVGIDEAKLEQVFDTFYRSGAASGQQSGSGLGLSIVKSFIELHGGAVSLHSTPGKGTTVICTLPRIVQIKREAA